MSDLVVMPNLVHHVHGKKRVRVARTWREGSVHHFVEWNVEVVIESAMAHAYKTPSNEGMTTTDTTKNQCYVVAKAMQKRCSPEEYALALGKQFVDSYPLISAVEVRVEQAPWRRTRVHGADHDHGHTFTAPSIDEVRRGGLADEAAGGAERHEHLEGAEDHAERVRGIPGGQAHRVEGHARAHLRHRGGRRLDLVQAPGCYDNAYTGCVRRPRRELFRPRARRGVLAERAVHAVPDGLRRGGEGGRFGADRAHRAQLALVPANPPGAAPFADDVYVATSEPHGQISCTVSAKHGFAPLAKL